MNGIAVNISNNNKQWLSKHPSREITSEEQFELSRDYLYPEIDFNFVT